MKLSKGEIAEIKEFYDGTPEGTKELAERLGITKREIKEIMNPHNQNVVRVSVNAQIKRAREIIGMKPREQDKTYKDYKKESNLICPKCRHIITNKDLKDWKCIKCGSSFKISFIKKIC